MSEGKGVENFLESGANGFAGDVDLEGIEARGRGTRKAGTWRDVKDSDITPFDAESLRDVCRDLAALPRIGDPYEPKAKGRGVKGSDGESFNQMKEYLTPIIVSMYQKGYNRAMIIDKLAKRLNIGKSNKFLKKLVYCSHKEYLEKYVYAKKS